MNVRETSREGSVKEAMNMLAIALDDETFAAGGGCIPRSYPYLALQQQGVDVTTYQIALDALESIGLVALTTETIAPGSKFATLAPQIKAAVAALRATQQSATLCEYCASNGERGLKAGGSCVGCGVGRVESTEAAYDRMASLDARERAALEDPTRWCNACGARTRSQCDCGPLALND
jgi:hypothetical protein